MQLSLHLNSHGADVTVSLFKDYSSPNAYKEFSCLVTCRDVEHRSEIPAEDLQELFAAIRAARIAPIGNCSADMLDGDSYQLDLTDGSASATYQWSMSVEDEWAPLAEIASRILHLGHQVSGMYLP